MILHQNEQAFRAIISNIHNKTGIRMDILEKDYYITLLLSELSQKPNQLYAYFKGGTALYKALKSIKRFSEDIDLTVFVEDCPNPSQAKKRLETATLKYKSIPRKDILENNKGNITCEYSYPPLFNANLDDPLRRFGNVKVEGTSFTISEPTYDLLISPLLYSHATEEEKQILEKDFRVAPFFIKTISLERIFIDKIYAAQYYFERHDYYDVAKHLYDLAVLSSNPSIQDFLSSKKDVLRIINLAIIEGHNRIGGVTKEIKDFDFFDKLPNDNEFSVEYEKMQNIYVPNYDDYIDVNMIFNVMGEIKKYFNNL